MKRRNRNSISGSLVETISGNNQIYERDYSEIMSQNGIKFFARLIHKKLENPIQNVASVSRVLELGAAEGEHLPYVKSNFLEYWQTDVRYSRVDIEVNSFTQEDGIMPPRGGGKVIKAHLDASDLRRFPDEYFDRIVATCLILHLEDIPKSLMEWRRVLKVGGSISVYVHCEPGFLLRVAQALSTKRQFTKRGINYKLWQYSEHVTYYLRAKTLMLKAFENDKIIRKKFPINFLSWNFALWEIWHIEKNNS